MIRPFPNSPGIRSRAAALLLLLVSVTVQAAEPGAWTEAVNQRDTDALARLLGSPDAPVNAAGRNDVTALMVAARAGRADLVRRLLERGGRVDAQRVGGATALLYAAQGGSPEVIALLLESGSAIDATAANGWSALTVAAATGQAEAVRSLLAAGADPNTADVYGWTPLMRAVDNGYPKAAAVLLESRKLRLDAVDDAGMTALHHAARHGMTATAAALLGHCADPELRDQNGFTPAMLARRTGHPRVATLLGRRPAACGQPRAS